MLHRTLLYHTQNTQSASENTAVLRESDRARCSTEHCCTHREWQSAPQNTAVLAESASHNIAVPTESDRVLHRTLLYSQRVTECFTEHCCTHTVHRIHRVLHRTLLYSERATEHGAPQNTAVLTESGKVLHRTLLYSQRVAECFTEHCCTHREGQRVPPQN